MKHLTNTFTGIPTVLLILLLSVVNAFAIVVLGSPVRIYNADSTYCADYYLLKSDYAAGEGFQDYQSYAEERGGAIAVFEDSTENLRVWAAFTDSEYKLTKRSYVAIGIYWNKTQKKWLSILDGNEPVHTNWCPGYPDIMNHLTWYAVLTFDISHGYAARDRWKHVKDGDENRAIIEIPRPDLVALSRISWAEIKTQF